MLVFGIILRIIIWIGGIKKMGFTLKTNIPVGNEFIPASNITVGDIVYNRYGIPITVTNIVKSKKQTYKIHFASNESIVVSEDQLAIFYGVNGNRLIDIIENIANNVTDDTPYYCECGNPLMFESKDINDDQTIIRMSSDITNDVVYNDYDVRMRTLDNVKRNSSLCQDSVIHLSKDNQQYLTNVIQLVGSLGYVPLTLNSIDGGVSIIASSQPRRIVIKIEKYRIQQVIDIQCDNNEDGIIVGDNCFVFELSNSPSRKQSDNDNE